jgi:hypothetical protein
VPAPASREAGRVDDLSERTTTNVTAATAATVTIAAPNRLLTHRHYAHDDLRVPRRGARLLAGENRSALVRADRRRRGGEWRELSQRRHPGRALSRWATTRRTRRGKAKNLREFTCEPGVVEVDRATSPRHPFVLKHHGYTGETLAARAKRPEVMHDASYRF